MGIRDISAQKEDSIQASKRKLDSTVPSDDIEVQDHSNASTEAMTVNALKSSTMRSYQSNLDPTDRNDAINPHPNKITRP
jgi:hypothetical protein